MPVTVYFMQMSNGNENFLKVTDILLSNTSDIFATKAKIAYAVFAIKHI